MYIIVSVIFAFFLVFLLMLHELNKLNKKTDKLFKHNTFLLTNVKNIKHEYITLEKIVTDLSNDIDNLTIMFKKGGE